MSIDLALSIEDEGWSALLDAEMLVERAIRAALAHTAPNLARGEISLVLSSDAEVQILNRQWRDKDKPTNVLSFPGEDDLRDIPDDAPPPMIGDIILAWGVVSAEATEQHKPLAHHVQHLVVHGVLHLLGFDHEDDAEADEMEALEREILAGLGVPDPYQDER